MRAIAGRERDAVVGLARRLREDAGLLVPCVGVGSTPTCSLPPEHLEGVDEMHPGNYAYFDMMQEKIGACRPDDVAVRVLTRVIGHYPRENFLLIDMGWTGCSAQGKEHGYGALLETPELQVVQLKQEAGEVSTADGSKLDYTKYPIGSILWLAPYHSCAATHQHAEVHVLADDRRTLVDSWKICKGW